MTNLASAQHLAQSKLQLPVSAYFDAELYQREIDLLLSRGLVTSVTSSWSRIGDYQTLSSENEGRVLVRNDQGLNCSQMCAPPSSHHAERTRSCRHIVCPLHRWTYKTDGTLLGAPHFDDQPCLNLGKSPLQNWQGLLLKVKRCSC